MGLEKQLNSNNKHKGIWRITIQIPFFNTKNGGINMVERFTITTTIVENGYLHYKVHDNLTGDEIHCELNELNESIWQLLGV